MGHIFGKVPLPFQLNNVLCIGTWSILDSIRASWDTPFPFKFCTSTVYTVWYKLTSVYRMWCVCCTNCTYVQHDTEHRVIKMLKKFSFTQIWVLKLQKIHRLVMVGFRLNIYARVFFLCNFFLLLLRGDWYMNAS